MSCPRSVAGGIGIALLAGCLTTRPVSYHWDVYPTLEATRLSCHRPPDGEGYRKTHLSMKSYRSLMRGTRYGPVILPGDSRKSILNMLVEGRADTSLRMPRHRREPLTAREIDTLRLWGDQGARDN